MKINLVNMNYYGGSYEEFSGGSLAFTNFAGVCQRLGHDVHVWLRWSGKPSRRPKDDPRIFDVQDIVDGWSPDDADVTIVHGGPIIPFKADWKAYDEESDEHRSHPDIIDLLSEQEQFYSRLPGDTIMVNIMHRCSRSENRMWTTYPDLIRPFDRVVTFGEGDGLVTIFKKIGGSHWQNLIQKIKYVQHNVLISLDHEPWTRPEDKLMRQFYWQGRGDSTWKGWPAWLDFKTRCRAHHTPINVTMNGIPPTIGVVKTLTTSVRPKKVFKPNIQYDNRKYTDITLTDRIRRNTMIYGVYHHDDSMRLLDRSGFSMYTTNLPTTMNYWPEYAAMESIMHGTVMAVPASYFRSDGIWAQHDPRDFGVLALPDHESDVQEASLFHSSDDWGRFIDDYHRMSTDADWYHACRTKAWETLVKNVDWDDKVRQVITI